MGTLDYGCRVCDTAMDLPDLEDLFFDEGGTIILTVSTSPINADGDAVQVIRGGYLTIDHDGDDDGLRPDGTTDGTNIANNGIKDIYENGLLKLWAMKVMKTIRITDGYGDRCAEGYTRQKYSSRRSCHH